MSKYSLYDFAESLNRTKLPANEIDKVIAAWGLQGDYSEWEGGFLMHLKDGRYAYIWGWCDTSGWGCQDGAQIAYTHEKPSLEIKRGMPQHFGGYIEAMGAESKAWEAEWDENPADLNKWLAEGANTEKVY